MEGFHAMLTKGKWEAILFTGFSIAGAVEIITGSIAAVFGMRQSLMLAAVGVAMWCMAGVVFGIFLWTWPSPPDRKNR